MTPIRFLTGLTALVMAFGAATAAQAQSPPTRIRGTISAIDGKTATIATREGASVKVNLADNWSVILVSPVAASEIKENSFVGIASMKGPDGTLSALEVLVFPEAARGSNEGHYPWDLQPESMMTNATVATVGQRERRPDAQPEIQGRHADHQGQARDADRHLRAGRQSRRQGGCQGVLRCHQGCRWQPHRHPHAGRQGRADAADVERAMSVDGARGVFRRYGFAHSSPSRIPRRGRCPRSGRRGHEHHQRCS